MNTYEFDIWYQVDHNGKFSHTVTRSELIHALNEEMAKKKIILQPSSTWNAGNGTLKIEATAEFIYATRRTGTVTKQVYYVYSDGRRPRPVGND